MTSETVGDCRDNWRLKIDFGGLKRQGTLQETARTTGDLNYGDVISQGSVETR